MASWPGSQQSRPPRRSRSSDRFDPHAELRSALARLHDRIDSLLGPVWLRPARPGDPVRLNPAVAVLVAYTCFLLGVFLALAGLPEGFDYGSCVISRLCSSHHNPGGYAFLTFGLFGLAAFLAPIPACYRLGADCCPMLGRWGCATFRVGLIATALIGVERGLCPTHWSRFEVVHFTMAGFAFVGLWLGCAMLVGARQVPRVRWRWLYRPPWYLSACVLPMLVVALLYLPSSIAPTTLKHLRPHWPAPLVFLRTATFWQWYLVVGLLFSVATVARRAARVTPPDPAVLDHWRVDPAQEAAPNLAPEASPVEPAELAS